MNEEQFLVERLLFFIETYPANTDFPYNNKELSFLLNIEIPKMEEIIQELLLTGFMQRKRVGTGRVLVSLRTEKEKQISEKLRNLFLSSIAQKEKKERSKEKKENNNQLKTSIRNSKFLLKGSKTFQISNTWKAWPESQSNPVGDEVEKVEIRTSIKEHILLWNSLQLKKCGVVRWTKKLKRTINYFNRLSRGTLFNNSILSDVTEKFTNEQIQESIRNFTKAVKDSYYEPVKNTPYHAFLSRVDLFQFLCNSNSESKIGCSLFYHYLYYPPKRLEITGVIPNKYPKITQEFKRFYILHVLGGVIPDNGFTPKEEDNFRMAATKTFEFYQKNKCKMCGLQIMGGVTQKVLAQWVCDCVEKDVKDMNKLTPGWFSSDTTFERRLPRYLYNQGIIQT